MSEEIKYFIKEQQVVLPKNKWFAERNIAEINETNESEIISFLEKQFSSIEEKTTLIVNEFEQAENKISLAGKIHRHKNYVCDAKAIGDYEKVLNALDNLEKMLLAEIELIITKKEAICENILKIDAEKGWKEATQQLQDYQKEFKALPIVPDTRNDELKEKMDQAINSFFNKKQDHFNEFDKELLLNLSLKIELCEKAESVQENEDWKKTTELLNTITEEWKNVGPIPRHRSEELWLRFNTAKDIFFSKKKVFYKELIGEFEKNVVVKKELIAKAEELKESKNWKKTSDDLQALMEEWKKSGNVSREENDKLWEEFRVPLNYFFEQKDLFYSQQKIQQQDALAQKNSIVTRAEEIKDSTDFAGTTTEYAELIEAWKATGFVNKKLGDELWERFMVARKHFYARKDEDRNARKEIMGKEIGERLQRNQSFSNKIERELDKEKEIVADFEDRLANISPGARSFETQERYQKILDEAKTRMNELEEKLNSVSKNVSKDRKDKNYIDGNKNSFPKKEFKKTQSNNNFQQNNGSGKTMGDLFKNINLPKFED